jgi:hypothetical protein
LSQCFHRACGQRTQLLFDLGPHRFNGTQIGAVQRQIQLSRAGALDRLANAADLVLPQVVHHHDLSGPQRGDQSVVDETAEDLAVAGRIEGHGRLNPAQGHGRDDRQYLPMSVRHEADQMVRPQASSARPRHMGHRAAFVDHHEVFQRDVFQLLVPDRTLRLNVRPPLLGGVDRLF